MATFYKYAERSAESQVNWAEIGKDMTDMLREEAALREQKKAALAESTRKLAEQISNAPQGESVSARAEALRFADQVTQQMLLEDRLLRAGLRNPRDFMISRQNTMDGTTQAFKSMKAFQEDYGKLMDGVRSGKTSILKVKQLEKIQGYGNFSQSGFFIDSPTGKISAGLKEEQIIDGQKVIGLKPGSTVGMEYLQGGVYGEFNKYDYRADITELSNSLGEEIRVTLDPATMSKLGSAKTLSDLQQRVIKIANEDPTKEKELFSFLNAMEKAINGYLVNDFNTASLLADTIGDDWTDDPEEAKKNPNTVLEVIDPNTGQAKYQITEANKTKALDFMMQQFLGTIDVKESIQGMGQVDAQYAPEYVARGRAEAKAADAAAGYWNQLYTGRTAAEKKAAADTLLGTPIAQQAGLLGIDLTTNGKIKLTYADPVKNRTIDYLDTNNNPVSLRDFSGLGVELHGVVDRDKAVKAGGGGTEFGKVNDLTTVTSQRQGAAPVTKRIIIPLGAITEESGVASKALQSALGPDFIVEDTGGATGNTIIVKTLDGVTTYPYTSKLKGDAALAALKNLKDWAEANKGGGTGVGSKY